MKKIVDFTTVRPTYCAAWAKVAHSTLRSGYKLIARRTRISGRWYVISVFSRLLRVADGMLPDARVLRDRQPESGQLRGGWGEFFVLRVLL